MGFCWKTKGYGEVRQEKGDMNRKVRQIKWWCGRVWESIEHSYLIGVQKSFMATSGEGTCCSCSSLAPAGWSLGDINSNFWVWVCFFFLFFFYPEVQWLRRSKLGLASTKNLCVNVFVSEGMRGRILLLSPFHQAVHQVEQ